MAKIYKPILNKRFPPYKADILIYSEYDLETYGINGKVIPWAGHTPGSVIIVLRRKKIFIGDIIRGGYLGIFKIGKPMMHYYSDDIKRDVINLSEIIKKFEPIAIYVGHGGPVTKLEAMEFIHQNLI